MRVMRTIESAIHMCMLLKTIYQKLVIVMSSPVLIIRYAIDVTVTSDAELHS